MNNQDNRNDGASVAVHRAKSTGRLSLFEGFGIEVEYMIVDQDSLDVLPLGDKLLAAANDGEIEAEIDRGIASWSNELVSHLIELKTTDPEQDPGAIGPVFSTEVAEMNRLLQPHNAMLMPTSMHPWMNPALETRLWQHEGNEIYRAYDAVFNCKRHGWANLQSLHLNLPFADEYEFSRLHAAIRLILPLIPALCASSPVADGEIKPFRDYRMEVYRTNSDRFPLIAGGIIPDSILTEREYGEKIYDPMMASVAKYNGQGIFKPEWLNSRGEIARFDRGSIEIRVIDSQECPTADIAIAEAIIGVVRYLVENCSSSFDRQLAFPTGELRQILQLTIAKADDAVITQPKYLELFGAGDRQFLRAADLWQMLIARNSILSPKSQKHLELIYDRGVLARRMLAAIDVVQGQPVLQPVYRRLCDCLASNEPFVN